MSTETPTDPTSDTPPSATHSTDPTGDTPPSATHSTDPTSDTPPSAIRSTDLTSAIRSTDPPSDTPPSAIRSTDPTGDAPPRATRSTDPPSDTPPSAIRSTDLTTKRAIWRFLVTRPSAQALAVAIVVLGTVRLLVGHAGRGDVLAVVATLAMTGTVEWVIHRYLLHAPLDSWTTRRLGTGTGHHRHHLDPTDPDWLLLGGLDAAVFVTLFGAVTAAWSIPLMWITGSSILGGFLTAWLCAAIGLFHYEFVHLMVHTRYRPRTRYYRGLARHHRLHHYRNEHFWLGVTSNTGDRLLRTLPEHKHDVPLSDTARTLGQ